MNHSSPSSTTRLKVILVGSNPSIKSNSDFAFFLDSKSGKTLQEWLTGIDAEFLYTNVAGFKTKDNRPLTRAEVKTCLPNLLAEIQRGQPDRIVALGKTAHDALTLLRLTHLEMPHPSGLNRKLNDQSYREQKIKELAVFCSELNSEIK